MWPSVHEFSKVCCWVGVSRAHIRYISLPDIMGTGLHWYWVVLLLQTTFIPVCRLPPRRVCTRHRSDTTGWEANDLWMDLAPALPRPCDGMLINHQKTTQKKMGKLPPHIARQQVPHLLVFSHIMFPSGKCTKIGSHFPIKTAISIGSARSYTAARI